MIDVEEALKKQTPKKPIIVSFLNVNYHKCPICNRTLWNGGEKYCGTCGQKIDWGDK